MTSLTSVELNYLIFRYLQESGFTHSAFALGYEAGINKCTIDANMVPPGALISFVQKGLQFLEMEANVNNSDADVDEDFSLLQPLDLITKDVTELQQIIKEKKRNLHKDSEKEKEKDKDRDKYKDKEFEREHERERARVREKERLERETENEKDRERLEREKEQDKQQEDNMDRRMVTDTEDKHEENAISEVVPEPMDISTASASQTSEIFSSDVMILEGHTSEVCACAWSPAGSLLASGSGDSTARIWTIAEETSRSGMQNGPLNVLVLKHVKERTNEKSKDVTTLDWNR